MTTTDAGIFTPPRSCSTTWAGPGNDVNVGVRCSNGALVDDYDCFAPATITITACPFNWKPVDTVSSTTTCCPGEWDLPPNFSGRCYSTAGAFILEAITCAPGSDPTSVTKTYPFTPGVYAAAISYVARITSSSTIASTTPSSILTSTPSTPPISTATSSPTSPPPIPSPKPALSAGAIAGIVIGALAGLALILTAIFLMTKRTRKSQVAAKHQPTSYPPGTYHGTHDELDEAVTNRNGQFGTPMSSKPHSAPFMAAPMELEGSGGSPRTNYR